VVLSIIIVNWKVRDLLRECLLSVKREMLLRAADYEVIVVDNASGDGSVEMLSSEFPEVRLIQSPVNLGFGAGCNKAYRISNGEFVLLLNPDTEVIDHAIDGLLDVMRSHPNAGIVAPRLMNQDRSNQSAAGGAFPTLRNVAWNYLFLKNVLPRRWAPPALFLDGDPRELSRLDWVSGAAMMLRRRAVGVQIFDESFFMFGEDMDTCHRLCASGWDVLYAGQHAVIHHHGRSFEQQKSIGIRAAAHDGPRRVFTKGRSRPSVLAYDAILLIGHLIRWPLYRVLDALRPGRGYMNRSCYARTYVHAMLHAGALRDSRAGCQYLHDAHPQLDAAHIRAAARDGGRELGHRDAERRIFGNRDHPWAAALGSHQLVQPNVVVHD
jgi:N-acetylglucosaminyl-diphospho-decaprenol L-rhamnosyltransferase